jgi:hypothetical protein
MKHELLIFTSSSTTDSRTTNLIVGFSSKSICCNISTHKREIEERFHYLVEQHDGVDDEDNRGDGGGEFAPAISVS